MAVRVVFISFCCIKYVTIFSLLRYLARSFCLHFFKIVKIDTFFCINLLSKLRHFMSVRISPHLSYHQIRLFLVYILITMDLDHFNQSKALSSYFCKDIILFKEKNSCVFKYVYISLFFVFF